MPSPPGPDPGDTLVPRAPAPRSFASGRYQVRRILGEGGQKVVYLVHDEALDRDCALSMVKAELLEPDDLERLRREAQTMARLGAHSNIVTVHDIADEDGKPYLVCEYVPGGELRADLRGAGGPLPTERAVAIATDVARALVVAHARGVIHRDVKPSNVWMNDDGSAKLGDFGLAFSLDRTRMTLPGSVMGTATYMAPEQARGEPADERTDLYALGVMLYEMVCGRPPFLGDDPLSVISQHASVAPVAPVLHVAGLPPALNDLILRLLAKSPDDRPQSAAAVGEELQRISESLRQPPSERTRFEWPQRPRMNRRRRRLVAGAALAVVAGVAIAATMVFALRGHGPARNTAASLPLMPEDYTPVLEPRDCPTELHRDPDVRCQNLVVPEDRANPAGRQVRVLVTVAASTAREAGVPLVRIGALSAGASDLREYGDVVGVGVRGTQFSEPVLACPEVASVQRQILGLPTNGPEANALFLDGAEQCGQRLASKGFDLSAYGDNEIVDDVRDLAIAMGWRQINVEGSAIFIEAADELSFLRTSRAAILLAASYPGLVHAVLLGQPYPADGARRDDIGSYNAAWQAYLAACRADPACERAFPNLEQAALTNFAEYQQKPALIMRADPAGGADIRVMMDGDRLTSALVLVLSDPVILPIVAQAVSLGEGAIPLAAATLVPRTPLDPEFPWGASFSEYCEGGYGGSNRVVQEAQAALNPLFGVFAHDPYLDLCARWPTKPQAIRGFETAIKAPALIITGALNPYAPPAYAQQAAKVFRDATVAVFPSLTNVFPSLVDQAVFALPPCIAALRLDFLRDPTAKLDVDGCIANVPPVKFAGT